MAVPVHDESYEFAKKFDLPIIEVIEVEMLKKQHTLVKVNILILLT